MYLFWLKAKVIYFASTQILFYFQEKEFELKEMQKETVYLSKLIAKLHRYQKWVLFNHVHFVGSYCLCDLKMEASIFIKILEW